MTKHDISKYIAEMEEEARKDGRATGYSEGWAAAMAAFGAFAAERNSPPPRSKLSVINKPEKTRPHRVTGIRPGSVPSLVLEKIKLEPGLTGVQIVKGLQREVDPKIEERTVRTSLRRLRVKYGLINQQGGRWYPV